MFLGFLTLGCEQSSTTAEAETEACASEESAVCEVSPPTCEDGSILIVIDGCWECVNQATCEPTNPTNPPQETTCTMSSECGLGEYCDECAGGSSCPDCADCIGLCVASTCVSEESAVCEVSQPTCDYGSILIIKDGCWECVDQLTCEPTDPISKKMNNSK